MTRLPPPSSPQRDYVGATTLLHFKLGSNRNDVKTREWLAYAYFHYGDHAKALDIYKGLLASTPEGDPTWHTYVAACYFYMGDYKNAEKAALEGPPSRLQVRAPRSSPPPAPPAHASPYHPRLGAWLSPLPGLRPGASRPP